MRQSKVSNSTDSSRIMTPSKKRSWVKWRDTGQSFQRSTELLLTSRITSQSAVTVKSLAEILVLIFQRVLWWVSSTVNQGQSPEGYWILSTRIVRLTWGQTQRRFWEVPHLQGKLEWHRLQGLLKDSKANFGQKSNLFDLVDSLAPDSMSTLPRSNTMRLNNQSNASRLAVTQMLKKQVKEFSQVLSSRPNK